MNIDTFELEHQKLKPLKLNRKDIFNPKLASEQTRSTV